MTILQPERVNGRQLHECLLIGLMPDKPRHVCSNKPQKLVKSKDAKNMKIILKHEKHIEKLENMKIMKLAKVMLKI